MIAIMCDAIDSERVFMSTNPDAMNFGELIGESTSLEAGTHEVTAEVYADPVWCDGGDDCDCCGDHDAFGDGTRILIGCEKKTKVQLIIVVNDDQEVDDVTVKTEAQ
jgi:hypothetical protein